MTTKEKIVVLAHEHDPLQPRHVEAMGLGSMDTLQRLMPEMVKEKLLKRITCERGTLHNRYACYRYGAQARPILAKYYNVPIETIGYTRIPLEDNTRWFNHSFLNTDNTITLHKALGEEFRYQKVRDFTADNIHKGARVRLTTTPDYSFTSYGMVYHVETDTGEEPIYRDNVKYQQSVYKKCLGYLGGLKYGRMKHAVLIITSTHERSQNMLDILQREVWDKGGKEFADFILINYVACLKNDPVHSWTNLAGSAASLLPER